MGSLKLVRLAAGGISTISPFDARHPEEAMPYARRALIEAGIINGLERDALERRRSKLAALWSPRSSFPYSGDLKVIALNPSSGMTMHARETLLDEHYRRMSAEPNLGIADAAVQGAFHGGLIGAGVLGLRSAASFRASGMPLGDALHSAIGPAAIGGAIGAGLGVPAGIMKGYRRSFEIRRARQYTGADLPTRRQLLRTEVSKALG